MNNDIDTHANDLTQLSSREQLSALMDGALPEDQTRFLLRRLQHDAELAGSWERWRIASDVMRGLAPAHRLPADFATRVSTALHGESDAAPQAGTSHRPAWLRWGGGAAMAAALAVVALMARPQLESDKAPTAAAPVQLAATSPALPEKAPAPQPSTPLADAPEMLAAAVAVAARPVRRASNRPATGREPTATPVLVAERITAPAAELPAIVPSEIVTRPWPRSILPQYSGNSGLTVGFGEHLPRAADNPFAPPVFDAPPKLLSDAKPQSDAAAPEPQQP